MTRINRNHKLQQQDEINEGWRATLVPSASFDTQSSSFFFFITMEVKLKKKNYLYGGRKESSN